MTDETLMTSGEVARLLKVDVKTVSRWAKAGLLRSIKTPGGHNRYMASDINKIINGETDDI